MGRFISRDPKGYVDGMSLYNGYFAEVMWIDPMGTRVPGGEYWPGSPHAPGGEHFEPWPPKPQRKNIKVRLEDRVVEAHKYLKEEKKSEIIGGIVINKTTECKDCLIIAYHHKDYKVAFKLERGYYHEYFVFIDRKTGKYIRDDGLIYKLWGEMTPFSEMSKEKVEVPGTAKYSVEYIHPYVPCPKFLEDFLDNNRITGQINSHPSIRKVKRYTGK